MENTDKTPLHIQIMQVVFTTIELSNAFDCDDLKNSIRAEIESKRGNISVVDYCNMLNNKFKAIESTFQLKSKEQYILGERITICNMPYKAPFEYTRCDGSFDYQYRTIVIWAKRLESIRSILDCIECENKPKEITTSEEVIPSTPIPRLPKELDTSEAKEIFTKAVEVGLMEQQGEGYKWHKSKVLLAYMLNKVYTNVFPGTKLDKLFGISGLKQSVYSLPNNKKPPKGYEEIDRLFKEA